MPTSAAAATGVSPRRRVLTLAPMPPEKSAYALARYSRSPDSIAQSIDWVRTHDSQKFLESFYFQYGHASIADLGHVVMCFEGISEVAATEVEDETLWDGQARSSRYQDFSRSGVVMPPEIEGTPDAARYAKAAAALIEAYSVVHAKVATHLELKLPRPEEMKPDAYRRNIAARAFDVARYLLPFGVPTGVGQITSIRTLEKQIRRLKASEFGELRDLASDIAQACGELPSCAWREGEASEPVAPTLARHVAPDAHRGTATADLRAWAAANLPSAGAATPRGDEHDVDLLRPTDVAADIAATLLYPATALPYRALYETAREWPESRRREVIGVALRSRTRRDELLREFRGGLFVYDIVMDNGAYRDLHRHRRCHQFRQAYGAGLGYETPDAVREAGVEAEYSGAVAAAMTVYRDLPEPARQYLLPLATRGRFLFKMDFAEAEYIARLRSGVKGHFSYRRIAWLMKQRMDALDPALGALIDATPPSVDDPLTR
jgi:thymidylate synthase ThyX